MLSNIHKENKILIFIYIFHLWCEILILIEELIYINSLYHKIKKKLTLQIINIPFTFDGTVFPETSFLFLSPTIT